MLSSGLWTDAMSGKEYRIDSTDLTLSIKVKEHGVKVLLLNSPNNCAELQKQLISQQNKLHSASPQ
jgi:cyclomaltodextrin glucanotransferase